MKDINREKAFLKRYGKTIECDVEYNMDGDNIKDYTVTLKSPKNTFMITEFMKDGLTKYVFLSHKDKQWNYPRFLEAEISVADLISEEV